MDDHHSRDLDTGTDNSDEMCAPITSSHTAATEAPSDEPNSRQRDKDDPSAGTRLPVNLVTESEPKRKAKTMTARALAANRRNAKRARGPVTDEGKKRSAMNAFVHGVHARGVAITSGPHQEDPDEVAEFLDSITDDLEHDGAAVKDAAQQYALACLSDRRRVQYTRSVIEAHTHITPNTRELLGTTELGELQRKSALFIQLAGAMFGDAAVPTERAESFSRLLRDLVGEVFTTIDGRWDHESTPSTSAEWSAVLMELRSWVREDPGLVELMTTAGGDHLTRLTQMADAERSFAADQLLESGTWEKLTRLDAVTANTRARRLREYLDLRAARTVIDI